MKLRKTKTLETKETRKILFVLKQFMMMKKLQITALDAEADLGLLQHPTWSFCDNS